MEGNCSKKFASCSSANNPRAANWMLALKSARPIGSWSAFVPLRICRCMLESVGMGIPSARPPARWAAAHAAGRGPCWEEPGGPVPRLCPAFGPKYWPFFPLVVLLEPSLVCIQTITLPYARTSVLVWFFFQDEAAQVKPDTLPILSVCFSTPAILLFGSNPLSSCCQNRA